MFNILPRISLPQTCAGSSTTALLDLQRNVSQINKKQFSSQASVEKGEAWPKEYRRNLEPPRDEICICSLRVHGMHQKGKHDCMLLKHPGDHLEQVRCEGSPLYLVWEEVKLPCPVARENKSQVSFQFSDLNKAS